MGKTIKSVTPEARTERRYPRPSRTVGGTHAHV